MLESAPNYRSLSLRDLLGASSPRSLEAAVRARDAAGSLRCATPASASYESACAQRRSRGAALIVRGLRHRWDTEERHELQFRPGQLPRADVHLRVNTLLPRCGQVGVTGHGARPLAFGCGLPARRDRVERHASVPESAHERAAGQPASRRTRRKVGERSLIETKNVGSRKPVVCEARDGDDAEGRGRSRAPPLCARLTGSRTERDGGLSASRGVIRGWSVRRSCHSRSS